MHWPNLSIDKLSMIKPLELPVNRRTRWSYYFLNGSLYWSSRHPDILYQQSGRCSTVLVELTTSVQKASMQNDVQWKPVCRKMCELRVWFTVSFQRNSGSTNSQMTSLRPPAASLSSQTWAGQAVGYLSTVYLSSVVYRSSSRQQCSLSVWTKKPWPSHQDSSYLTVLVLSCPLCRYLIERGLQSLEMILFLWNPSLVITLPCPSLS